jgi:hypothetical protein
MENSNWINSLFLFNNSLDWFIMKIQQMGKNDKTIIEYGHNADSYCIVSVIIIYAPF